MKRIAQVPSAEQSLISRAYTGTESVIVKYIDLNTAVEHAAFLIDSAISHKKIAILCEDPGTRSLIMQSLEKRNLSDFVFTPKSFSPVSDKHIGFLRGYIKDGIHAENVSVYAKNTRKQSTLASAIEASYQCIQDPIYESWNLEDVVYIINKNGLGRRNDLLPIAAEDLNKDRYQELLQTIKEVADIYDEIFTIYDHSNLLSDSAFDRDQSELAEVLDTTLRDLRDLRKRYIYKKKETEIALSNYSQTSSTSFDHFVDDFLSEMEALSLVNPMNKKRGFFAKKSTNVWHQHMLDFKQNIAQEWQIDISLGRVDTYEDLVTYVTSSADRVRTDLQQQSNISVLTLSRISTLNSSDGDILALSNEYDQLLKEINNSQLFNKTYENNTFSFVKQLDNLETLIREISSSQLILKKYPSYITWKQQLRNASEDTVRILNLLSELPKNEWIDVFERSFLHGIVHYAETKGSIRDTKELDDWYELSTTRSTYRIDKILTERKDSIDQHLETLKKQKKSTYQNLTKKKLPLSMTCVEFTQETLGLADHIFPVHLLQDMVSSLDDYDIILNFDAERRNIDRAINYGKFQDGDFANLDYKKSFPLFLNHYDYDQPLDMMNNYDKLRAAKKLAKYILYVTQHVKIYQTKDANIISTLTHLDDVHVSPVLDRRGAKQLAIEDIYDTLTESLLETGRQQYIIIKDGLIKSKSDASMYWQYETLQILKAAGIHVINIWSLDMYDDETTLTRALEHMLPDTEYHIEDSEHHTMADL